MSRRFGADRTDTDFIVAPAKEPVRELHQRRASFETRP